MSPRCCSFRGVTPRRRVSSQSRRRGTVRFRPILEGIEDRTLLSNVTWIGPTGGDWYGEHDDNGQLVSNWDNGSTPGTGDVAVIGANENVLLNPGESASVQGVTADGTSTLQVGGNLSVSGASTIGSLLVDSNTSSVSIGGAATIGSVSVTQGGMLTLDGTTTVSGTFDLGTNSPVAAGTLSGAGAVTIDGLLTLEGQPFMSGTGQTVIDGGANFDFNAGLGIDTRSVVNNSTVTWAANSGYEVITFVNSPLWTNSAGSTFDAQAGSNLQGSGEFINDGTFSADPGAGNHLSVAVPFSNVGTVSVSSGTFSLTDFAGTQTGPFTVAQGGTLDFEAVGTLAASSGLSGAGTVEFSDLLGYSSDVTVDCPVNLNTATGAVVDNTGGLAGDAVEFPNNVTIPALTMESGALTGAGAVTVTGPLSWQNGTMSGTGQTIADGGVTIGSGGLVTRTFVNNGMATMNVAGGFFAMGQGATFMNSVGSSFSMSQPNITIRGASDYNATFMNAGVFAASPGAGKTSSVIIPFTNTGTVSVTSGSLEFVGGGSSTGGTLSAATGAGLIFVQNPFTLSGTVTISGAINSSGYCTLVLDSGTMAVGTAGATLNFSGGSTFQWGGGTVDVSKGALTIAGAMTVTGAGTEDLTGSHGLTDNGQIIQTGAGSLRLDNRAKLTIGAKGSFDLQAGSIVPGSGTPGTVTNSGLLEKTQGNGTATVSAALNTTGKVTAYDGTLDLSGTVSQVTGSTLTGGTWTSTRGTDFPAIDITSAGNITTIGAKASVTLGAYSTFTNLSALASNAGSLTLLGGETFATAGDFTNSGKLTLGPGSVLSVNGNFTATSVGKVTVQIGGSSSAPVVGSISATGTVTLAGALSVTSTVTPAVGTALTLIDNQGGSPVSGIFSGLPEGTKITVGGKHYKISYVGGANGRSVVLTRVT